MQHDHQRRAGRKLVRHIEVIGAFDTVDGQLPHSAIMDNGDQHYRNENSAKNRGGQHRDKKEENGSIHAPISTSRYRPQSMLETGPRRWTGRWTDLSPDRGNSIFIRSFLLGLEEGVSFDTPRQRPAGPGTEQGEAPYGRPTCSVSGEDLQIAKLLSRRL
jgi:hypothetical protein